MRVGHLSLRAAAGIIRTVERLGLPTAPLWELLEATPAELADPDSSVPIARVYALWELVDRALSRDDLAIEVASSGRRPPSDVFGFVIMTSPTAHVASENAIRFMGLVTTSARWSMERTPEQVWLVQAREETRRGAALAVEASFGEAVARMREMLGTPGLAFDATFRHAAPRDLSRHRAFFGGRVTFEAPRHTLCLPARALEQPMPKGDAALAAYFEGQADLALAKLSGEPDTTVDRVRRCLSRDLTALPSLERVARELALSERTLRRRLELEGVGFQALVDEVRASVACQHLSAPRLSVGEVAYLLGFSEPSAFHRAFKRWTGLTPNAYRRAQSRLDS